MSKGLCYLVKRENFSWYLSRNLKGLAWEWWDFTGVRKEKPWHYEAIHFVGLCSLLPQAEVCLDRQLAWYHHNCINSSFEVRRECNTEKWTILPGKYSAKNSADSLNFYIQFPRFFCVSFRLVSATLFCMSSLPIYFPFFIYLSLCVSFLRHLYITKTFDDDLQFPSKLLLCMITFRCSTIWTKLRRIKFI